MFHSLTVAILKDLITVLKKEKGFMGLSEDQRTAKAPAVAALVKGMNEEQLLEDIKTTVKVIKGSAMAKESQIAQALGRYFTTDFPQVFDQLGNAFFHAPQAERLQEVFPEQAAFYNTLKQVLMVESAQELTEQIVQYLSDVFQSPRILVQSPVECDQETKTAIRAHYFKEYPQSFVAFSVNPQLIGGIRFFVDGQVVDHSWFARIGEIRKLRDLVTS